MTSPIPTARLEELIRDYAYFGDAEVVNVARELLAAREALAAARAILEEDRAILIECHSHLRPGDDGEMVPVDGTLEPEVAETVAEYDRTIEACGALIPQPEKVTK